MLEKHIFGQLQGDSRRHEDGAGQKMLMWRDTGDMDIAKMGSHQ